MEKNLGFSRNGFIICNSIPPSINGQHIQEDMNISYQRLCNGILRGNIDLTYDVDDIPSTIRPELDIVRVDLYIEGFE